MRGFATVKLDIPNNLNLIGRKLYLQWVVEDAGAPTGTSATRGAEIEILP